MSDQITYGNNFNDPDVYRVERAGVEIFRVGPNDEPKYIATAVATLLQMQMQIAQQKIDSETQRAVTAERERMIDAPRQELLEIARDALNLAEVGWAYATEKQKEACRYYARHDQIGIRLAATKQPGGRENE